MQRIDDADVEMKSKYTRFVIVSQPRTGSSLLQFLLSSHPHVKMFDEIFHPQEFARMRKSRGIEMISMDDDPKRFLREHVFCEYPDDVRAVGFKLFHAHAREGRWQHLWDYLKSSDLKIVLLKRRNLLDRYISFQLALKSENWMSWNGEELEAVGPIVLEPEQCFQDIGQTQWLENRSDNFFQGNPTMTLAYEDLADNTVEVCRNIQAFLHLEYRQLSCDLMKQRAESKSTVISNYGELKQYCVDGVSSGTINEEWIAFFDDT